MSRERPESFEGKQVHVLEHDRWRSVDLPAVPQKPRKKAQPRKAKRS